MIHRIAGILPPKPLAAEPGPRRTAKKTRILDTFDHGNQYNVVGIGIAAPSRAGLEVDREEAVSPGGPDSCSGHRRRRRPFDGRGASPGLDGLPAVAANIGSLTGCAASSAMPTTTR